MDLILIPCISKYSILLLGSICHEPCEKAWLISNNTNRYIYMAAWNMRRRGRRVVLALRLLLVAMVMVVVVVVVATLVVLVMFVVLVFVLALFFCCCCLWWWWWWRWWSTLITFSNHIVWFPSAIISYHDGHTLLPIKPITIYHTAHIFGVLNDVANCQLPNGCVS